MKKTNSGLIEFCKARLGDPYWYGTYTQKSTMALYRYKKAQYPAYYPPMSWSEDSFTSQIGRRVTDCAGLIKGYLWCDTPDSQPVYRGAQDYGANGFYGAAVKKGPIDSFDRVPGRLVFKDKNGKKTHVGVYVGDGYVIEAKGHAYGVVKTKLAGGGWTHWAQCHLIKEDGTPEPQPTPTPTEKPKTPTLPKRGYFQRGDKGKAVEQLQRCLLYVKPGCLPKYGIDGDIGSETVAAVKTVQGILGVKVDGLWGNKTQAAYKGYKK